MNWNCALAVVTCLLLLCPAPAPAQDVDGAEGDGAWHALFNGRNLDGWVELNGDHVFEARDGMIVGETVPGQPNGFLTTEAMYGDFILELEVKVDVLMNNSGIQFRSLSHADYRDYRVHGYQAEIDTKPQRWSGSIYDEARRGWLYILEQNPAAKTAFVNNAWNHYRIEAIGTTNRIWVNGVPTAHLVDDETLRGFIGLQLHANNPDDPPGRHRIRFRNLRIRTENLQPSPYDDIFVVNLIPNHLSGQERTQGLELLWDGASFEGWSGPAGASAESMGWTIDRGVLRSTEEAQGPLLSTETFGAFEMTFAFNPLDDEATCALRFHARSEHEATGDARYCRMASQKIESGWNRGVIRVHPDRQVEYWLNGWKILEYWLEEEAPPSGRIMLGTEAGDVAYRSLKIRRLD